MHECDQVHVHVKCDKYDYGLICEILGPREMASMLSDCLCDVEHKVLVVENLENKKRIFEETVGHDGILNNAS